MSIPLPLILSILLIGLVSVLILRLYLKRFRNSWEWLLFIAGSAPGLALCLFIGPWAFLSIHLRWVFLAIYLVGAVVSYRRSGTAKRSRTSTRFILKRVFFILLFGCGVFLYFRSKTYQSEPVRLSFPLKSGKYYIMQGGSNFLSNPFHAAYDLMSFGYGKDVRYAMDIARLNEWGNRANTVYSKKLADYAIYNDIVYAPCLGSVLKVKDGVPENVPGTMKLEEVYGNHIIIQGPDYRVILAHLRKGTILVKEGDKVIPGHALARLGNSGKSVEPHLHIDAVRNYQEDDPESGESAPIVFSGNFYTINDIIQSE